MPTCDNCKRDFMENSGGSLRGDLIFCTGICLMDYFHPCNPKEEQTK